MKKGSKKDANKGSGAGIRPKRTISSKLLVVVLPMVTASILFIILFLSTQAKSIIIEQSQNALENETNANANDIARTMNNIRGYYDGLVDVMEASVYEDDAAILAALAPGMEEYSGTVIDVYIGLSDRSFYDGGGWVPDADYDPTTRVWYENGFKENNIIYGVPRCNNVRFSPTKI